MKKYTEMDFLFKDFQSKIGRKDTFEAGKASLLELRNKLMGSGNDSLESSIWAELDSIDFSSMPLKKEKTIAYYLYHLARIEDITSNVLMKSSQQVFFKEKYDVSLNSPILTTGNELAGEEIPSFSKQLDLAELRKYRNAVFQNTNEMIRNLTYGEAKTRVRKDDLEKTRMEHSISESQDAVWLLDYWGSKDYIGLMLMPFSRHQMLHLAACRRIVEKLKS